MIATHPVLLEVVGVFRNVVLWSFRVEEDERTVFQEEVVGQSQNRWCIGCRFVQRIQIKSTVDVCELRIQKKIRTRNPGMRGFVHLGWARLQPRCGNILLVGRESVAMVKVLRSIKELEAAFVRAVVSNIGFQVHILKLNFLRSKA